MLLHDTPPYRSKRPWPGWQHSAACMARKTSSKHKVLFILCLSSDTSVSTLASSMYLFLCCVHFDGVVLSNVAVVQLLEMTIARFDHFFFYGILQPHWALRPISNCDCHLAKYLPSFLLVHWRNHCYCAAAIFIILVAPYLLLCSQDGNHRWWDVSSVSHSKQVHHPALIAPCILPFAHVNMKALMHSK